MTVWQLRHEMKEMHLALDRKMRRDKANSIAAATWWRKPIVWFAFSCLQLRLWQAGRLLRRAG